MCHLLKIQGRNMNIKLIFAAISIALLSGCDSPSIKTVKASKLAYDDSYLIGQAFSNRAVCESENWSEYTDDRGRDLVAYECTINGVVQRAKEYFEESRIRRVKKITEDFNLLNEGVQKYAALGDLEAKLAEKKKEFESNIFVVKDISFIESDIRSRNFYNKKMAADFPQGLDAKLDELNRAYESVIYPVSVTEQFNWSVMPDDEVAFSHNVIIVKFSDDEIVKYNYNIDNALQIVYENKFRDITYYAELWGLILKKSRNKSWGGDYVKV